AHEFLEDSVITNNHVDWQRHRAPTKISRRLGGGGTRWLGKENAADPESSEKSSAELARYALLRVQLARSEARLKSGELKTKKPASKSYFNLRSLLGLDAHFWLVSPGLLHICLLVHGTANDYFSVTTSCPTLEPALLLSAEDFNHGDVEGPNFSLDFFKNLYDSKPDSYKVQDDAGQFFAYKTEFGTLREALHMSEERRQKDWYFAGATRRRDRAEKLRQYYSRRTSCLRMLSLAASTGCSWASPGRAPAAHRLCVRPSWQAQIKAAKSGRWCLRRSVRERLSLLQTSRCMPGDILNIDTNRWYHATYVYPGDFSATIGSDSSNKSSSLRIARQAASIDDAQREDTCDAQLDRVYRRVASIVIHPNLQGYWVLT
uniref:JmjC domain-containing protein n=1 Tax=Macrostomum lignano TaxID=282301 RepID=A0A1I8FDI8_9PLAT